MKILYLHQYFNTPSMAGGTRSFEMARRFVAAGHEVHMITSRRDANVVTRRWETTEEAGIHVHWYPVAYDNTMKYRERVLAFFRFVLAAGRKAVKIGGDVVFATSTPLTIALPAVRASRRLKISMVFEVRDLWPKVPIAIGAIRNPLLKYAALRLERFAYSHASSVVALSPGMAAGVANTGYPRERIHEIPNGCDTELFDVGIEPGARFRNSSAWLGERPLVVYTGAFGRINGVGYLVEIAKEALKIDPEMRFALVGHGLEYNKVLELAEFAGVLNQNLWVWGPIPKAALPELLSAATVATSLVIDLPELWNNSANKFFDALASGTPVAINYQGWQSELLLEEEAGITLASGDACLAARQLCDLLRDDRRLHDMSRNARRLAYERFSRERLAARLLQVLESAGPEVDRYPQ